MRNQAKGNGSHTCDHIINISLVWHVLHFFTYGRMDGNYCESLHRNPGTVQKIGRPEEVDNLISMEFLRQVSTHMCILPKNTHVVQPNIQCRRHFSLFKIPSSSPTNHHLANMLDIRQLLLYSLLKLLNLRCLCFKMRYWPNYHRHLLCNRSMLTKNIYM